MPCPRTPPLAAGERGTARTVLAAVLAAGFVLAALAAALPARAEPERVLTGIVERNEGGSLVIGGNRYDIAGAAVRNPSGYPVEPGDIVRGTKADLHFRGGQVRSVVVYPRMVE